MSNSKAKSIFLPMDLDEMRPQNFLAKLTQSAKEKHDKVAQKNGWREVHSCPVCDSVKRRLEFVKFEIEIFCCENCSLRYSGKIPIQTEDIYSDSIYLPKMIKSYEKNVDYRKQRFGRERITLIKSHIKSNNKVRLLDIGCGTGWFLEVAKEHGFEASGQELGKELAQWTSQKLGITIWDCSLDEIETQEPFDVITMFDLLEHVPDPLTFNIDG